ncbi:CYTH domain-containing protein [Microbacterium elymi]|uniref:CYTH domain-containing protein n=1 Tax=Microbacterium elymi TaxID=2909587 RepID=UPI00338DC640
MARVDEPEHRALDARYLDTAERTLARQRIAVRRREGGPDAGWHVKASAAEGRHEWHWPLGADAEEGVPAEVAAILAEWSAGPFQPLARIRNRRTAYTLRDAEGALVAEVVDDQVSARDERAGTESSWREWEVELGPAAPADVDAFFSAVDALVARAGGRPAASDSKLARALGA